MNKIPIMIDFSLSNEQQQLQDLARKFAKEEIIPQAAHHDQTGEYPWEIFKKAWELGLMNTHVPQKYGGLGLGMVESCIIAEELCYGCSGIATAMETNALASAPLEIAGNDAQKKEFLSQLTEQGKAAAYCVTEPGAGSDVSAVRTTAKKSGGEYVINGSKMWVTNGGVASWYFVLTSTDQTARHKGMTAFVIPADTPGIVVGKKERTMGQRASDTRGLTFENVNVPAKYRIGNEGDGFKLVMKVFDHTRTSAASGAVGVARRAMDESIDYAKTRTSFGSPIAGHQAVGFMIANMAMEIAAARLLVWQSAWAIDQGVPNTRFSAFAKAFAADMCMRVTTDAVQVFGGCGYSSEYPVEKLMRDAKIYQIYEGTSQIQRLVIAKEIFVRS